MNKSLLAGVILFLAIAAGPLARAQETLSIIPYPKEVTIQNGYFQLTPGTPILATTADSRKSAELFNQLLLARQGFSLPITQVKPSGKAIILGETEGADGNERYELEISPEQILLTGRKAGIFYGLQTVLQLIESRDGKVTVPAAQIKDEPAFAYRGLMLDVSRHFFSTDQIKKMLDLMGYFKFNRMHWHLTEDQGWRLEIKKYPKLTQVSAWRDSTIIGQYYDFKPFIYDGKPHGGYYTQEEARDIVRYAAERHITVIPEIELPGHSSAVLAAYPELGSFEVKDGKALPGTIPAKNDKGEPYNNELNTYVPGYWGVHYNIYGPTEKAFGFLEDVLTEVMEIFPSEYIHIGGDEVPKDQWITSEIAQKVIKKEKLADEHELQSFFIRRIEKFLNKNGRKLIGWDEILEGGLAPNATVMSWRGEKGGIEAAKMGHDVIMTPNSHLYFDHYQAADKTTEPLAIGGFLPLKKVYSYSPIPESLTTEEQKHVLGVQANLWTEYIPTNNKMEYFLFPRALALAEVAWKSKEEKNFKSFTHHRLPKRLAELEERNVFFRIPEAEISISRDESTKRHLIAITPLVANAEVFYTVDGHKADQTANRYTGAFLAPIPGEGQGPLTLRYILVTPGGRSSNEFQVEIKLP
ncbi:beta-N-acetylhexosaminidase [Lunatimonas salinarum]|uniref:beta-N-acetylhexosaminidase n=1 Tax=Lunatimonas salinarum TaxID=1774590 RepID=UPI001ADEE1EF|nr:family 20 glycosylhydrolase [Lunatimonas salinarum]